MPPSAMVRRVWGPTLLTAATSTAIAIAVNFATDSKTNSWAWIAVAALTVLAFIGSLWLHRRQQIGQEPAKGTRIGGDVRIDAKHGSASAWKMRNVSFEANPPRARGSHSEPPQPDVEVKGNVDIEADQGSAAAWSMDNVSMDRSRSADPRPPGPPRR